MFIRSLLLVPFLTQGKVMETRFLRVCPLRNEIVYYLDHTWIAINLCFKKKKTNLYYLYSSEVSSYCTVPPFCMEGFLYSSLLHFENASHSL